MEHTVGPYTMVRADAERECAGSRFWLLVYGAFNAHGLIGPEHNGIVVLNRTRHTVVLDGHCREDSGYYGASTRQLAELARLQKLSDQEFMAFVNAHPNARESERFESLAERTARRVPVSIQRFGAEDFPTPSFYGAKADALFCNQYVRFVRSGFRRQLFHKTLYRRLSNCFYHIAEYNVAGFYETWFSTPERQRAQIRRVLEHPAHTPVEQKLQRWAVTSNLLEHIHG